MNTTIPDEKELRAECERYQLATAGARADIEAQTGEKIPAPSWSNDDLFANLETWKAHAIQLTAKLEEINKSIKAGTFISAEIAAIEKETAAIKLEIQEKRAEIVRLEAETKQIKAETEHYKALARPVHVQLAEYIVKYGIGPSGKDKGPSASRMIQSLASQGIR